MLIDVVMPVCVVWGGPFRTLSIWAGRGGMGVWIRYLCRCPWLLVLFKPHVWMVDGWMDACVSAVWATVAVSCCVWG